MKTTSIPTEQIEALVDGLQFSDGDAISGTIQNGQLSLSVLDASDLAELKDSLDNALTEEPKPLDRDFMNKLKERAASARSS